MGANKAAESSNITNFEITSNSGEVISISGGLVNLSYYESILDTTVRVTATFVDTGNREGKSSSASLIEKLDASLTAGEKVFLTFNDGQNPPTKISFKERNQLRVKEVRNVIEDTFKSVFTVDFFSKEVIENELAENRVIKRYEGKITDSAIRIIRECLKSQKTVDADSCINELIFNGGTEKPFYKLAWLASRTVPEMSDSLGTLAGYFFYETSDGYKFKSIDKLFEQPPKKKLIYNNTTGLPSGYDAKILDFTMGSIVDIEDKLKSGAISTQLRTLDMYDHDYEETEFDSSGQFKRRNNAGRDRVEVATDLELDDKPTKIITAIPDTGVYQELDKKTELNFDINQILRQSIQRYNNLFTVKLTIAIAGDFSLHPGDLLHCDFPEISNQKNQKISYRKSGIYMIVDVAHKITPTQTFTRLNLVRDTTGRKPF